MTPDRLLRRALDADPARPLLTFYDRDGARVELSVATFDNWVAKTANLLVDACDVRPGQRVAVALPVHWQAAVWHAACWVAGLVSVAGEPSAVPDLAVVPATSPQEGQDRPDTVAAAVRASGGEVVGLGLGPLGLPRPDGHPHAEISEVTLDYDREVHAHGDRFVPPAGAGDAGRPALEVPGASLTAAELVADAQERSAAWDLPEAARVLVLRPMTDLPAVAATLLLPLLHAGGAVLSQDAAPGRLAAWARDEGVCAVLGAEPGLLPDLAVVT